MPYVPDVGGGTFSPGDPPQGVCIAFDDNALGTAVTWTRLDDPQGYNLASSWSITRGRSSEFDKTTTGVATVMFNDREGILDPTNTSSPFYDTGGTATKLNPQRQCAISLLHPVSGTWHPLFTGFVSEQEHDLDMWSEDRGNDVVSMEWEDAFAFFAALELTPGVHGDTPSVDDFADVYYHGIPSNLPGETAVFCHVDDRIIQLLTDSQWPTSLQDIFSGNVSVQGKVYERGDTLLAALFDAADAEFPGVANIYVSKSGIVRFRGRYARFNPTTPGYGITTWKAGGLAEALADPTVAPIAALGFRRSNSDIINAVLCLPQGVDEADAPGQLIKDDTSIATYGYRSKTWPNLLTSAGHNDDMTPTTALDETAKFADYTVGNYKDPKTRVSLLRFRPRGPEDPTAPALWDLMCGVELGDRVHLETGHPDAGGFDEYFYVEGIRYAARGARDTYHDVTLELDVSPASFFAYNPFGTVDEGTS